VRVRGGAKLDLTWSQGRLTGLRLQADHALRYRVSYGYLSADAPIEPDRPIVLDGGLRHVRP
jgi:hypothetical protein